ESPGTIGIARSVTDIRPHPLQRVTFEIVTWCRGSHFARRNTRHHRCSTHSDESPGSVARSTRPTPHRRSVVGTHSSAVRAANRGKSGRSHTGSAPKLKGPITEALSSGYLKIALSAGSETFSG